MSDLFDVSVDSLLKGDVEEMTEALVDEARRLNRLGVMMAVCGVGTIAWVLGSVLMDLDWAMILIPGAALFVPAAVCAGMAEKIKCDNRLYTYRSVEAFMRGEAFDVEDTRNLEAGKARWAKLFAKTVIAAVIGFCFGWGLMSILQRIIG